MSLTLAAAASSAAGTPGAEVELRAANHARVQAQIVADRQALSRLIDEDFRYTGADGVWLDRAAFLEAVGERALPATTSYDDVRVQVFDEVALVHGTLVSLQANGSVARTRYTDVYRRDQSWRLVSEQLSPLADAERSPLIRESAPPHAPWQGEYPAGSDEQILRTLNTGYVQAFLDSNVGWYDAHLAPEYLVVFGDGTFHDKGSLLAAAARPVTNMKSFPTVQVAIRRFGNVALIHAENPYERKDGLKGVNRYTDIWHKRDGRWTCIAAHVTRRKVPS
jgi:ketosteroid isomerase-like protein